MSYNAFVIVLDESPGTTDEVRRRQRQARRRRGTTSARPVAGRRTS
jgi:hypothetical protein